MVSQHLEDRQARLGPALLHARELGALGEADADERADAHERDAHEERDAPAPAQERVLGQARREREDPRRQQQARRRSRLRPAAVEATPSGGGVFGRHEHGAAPLAPETEALNEAQRHEQDRSADADLRVGRQQADRERGHAHDEEREAEHRLAPDAVAVVPEHDAADRPRDEPHREGREGEHGAHQGIEARKEQLVEDERRRRSVEKEVVPLDGSAHEARDGDVGDGCLGRDRGRPRAGSGQCDVEHGASPQHEPGQREGPWKIRVARWASDTRDAVRSASPVTRSGKVTAHGRPGRRPAAMSPSASRSRPTCRRLSSSCARHSGSSGFASARARRPTRSSRGSPAPTRTRAARSGSPRTSRLAGAPARYVRRGPRRARDLRAAQDVPARRGARSAAGQAPAAGVRGLGACPRGPRLVLDTTEQMTRAIRFYEENGFVRDDTQVRGSRCSRGYVRDL